MRDMGEVLMRNAGRICCLLVCGTFCFAQDASLFTKAPPDVDEALRARINKFYQAHVDGKFRAADAYVAEDSKDAFFGATKRRCRAFAITSITYSDNFSRAAAVTACDDDVLMPPVGLVRLHLPTPSQWKVVDGQWFWYVDPVPEEGLVTPFGIMKPQPDSGSGPGAVPMPSIPTDIQGLYNMIKVDKKQVAFDAGVNAVQRIVVTNGMPGEISLKLAPAKIEGFEMTFDKTKVGAGQSATLSLSYQTSKERKPRPTVVNIIVEPIGHEIPIQIGFK